MHFQKEAVMNPSFGKSSVWRPWQRALVGGMTVAALCLTFAGEAKAACVSKNANPGPSVGVPKIRFGAQVAATSSGAAAQSHSSIVGLWNVTFLLGDGPDVYDQGFQHWHSDGTELMVDNAVSPAFGNVCVGVWKQVGTRTYKLKHMTFNWDAQGKVAGTFILEMTVRLDRRGNEYEGTYVTDSYDLSGNVVPELHAEGVVRGSRITVQ
jgi:hypothetical protein